MSLASDPMDAQARARACAQRAIQLARTHRFDEAEQAMAEGAAAAAAAAATATQAGPAFVELALARATLMYFGNEQPASVSVLLQARADAQALGLTTLDAECAATLSLHLLQLDRSTEAIEQAAAALRLCAADAHGVRYRACLAIANACQSGAATAHAFGFYRQALDAARAMGDAVATRSTVGRMANAQALEAQRLNLLGRLDGETLKQAIVGVRSGAAWGPAANKGMDGLENIVLGMLLRIRGDHDEAEALFEHWRPHVHTPLAPMLLSDMAGEQALCRLARGDAAAALAWCEEARRCAVPGELAVGLPNMLNNVAVVLHALGSVEAADARAQAERALAAFEQRRHVRSVELERQLHEFQLIG